MQPTEQSRQQLRCALRDLGARAEKFNEDDLNNLLRERYKTLDDLREARADSLRAAGLPLALVDHIVAVQRAAAAGLGVGSAAGAGVAAGVGTTRTATGGSPGGGGRRRAGNKLTTFWEKLPSAQVETRSGQEVLVLDEGEFPFPQLAHMKHLLRRSCYNVAYHKITASLQQDQPVGVRRFLIIGTPGIGKSAFLLDLLYRLACKGRTVVLYAPGILEDVVLFTPAGVFTADSPKAFQDELGEQDTWFLCDSGDYPEKPAVTVLASSPRVKKYHEFDKSTHNKLWMGPWSLAELQAGRQLMPKPRRPNAKTVKTLYMKWGGIPRFVLANAMVASMQTMLDDAISSCCLPDVLQSVHQHSAVPDTSHKLLHVQVDNECQKVTIIFGSDEIARRVIEKYQANGYRELQHFIGWAGTNPTLAVLRGVLFQHYCHNVLLQGGNFRVRDLTVSGSVAKSLKLPPIKRLDVSSLAAASPGCLLIPQQKNFAAIDSVLVLPKAADVLTPPPQVLLIQVTVARSHAVKKEGLQKAAAELPPAIKNMTKALIFAVPPDVFGSFEKQRFVGAEKGSALLGDIKQYALEVPVSGFGGGTAEVEAGINANVAAVEPGLDQPAVQEEEQHGHSSKKRRHGGEAPAAMPDVAMAKSGKAAKKGKVAEVEAQQPHPEGTADKSEAAGKPQLPEAAVMAAAEEQEAAKHHRKAAKCGRKPVKRS